MKIAVVETDSGAAVNITGASVQQIVHIATSWEELERLVTEVRKNTYSTFSLAIVAESGEPTRG